MENSLKQKQLEESALVDSKELYRGRVISLKRDILHFPTLPPHQWDLITHPGAVAIIPITNTGNLLLIQQWRRGIEKIIYELPAGTIDHGEPPLSCAKRELQEEVGYKAKKFTPMGGFFTTPGFCNEYIHLFIAENLELSSLPQDDHEAIDVVEMPLKKALSLIDTNEINDAKTICGLLRYARRLKNA